MGRNKLKYTELIAALNISSFIISIIFICLIMHEKNKNDIHYAYLFLQISISIWCFGSIFSVIAKNSIQNKFCIYFEYFGLSFIGAAMLIFTLTFLNYKPNKLKLILILIPSSITLIGVLTNDIHHKFYTFIGPEHVGFGSLFWLHCFFTYFYILLTVVMYIRYAVKNKNFKLSIIIILSISITCLINILIVFGVIKNIGGDLTTSSFSISNIVLCIVMLNYRIWC